MAEQKINSTMLSNNVKAFVYFNGLGTPVILDTYNVASVTDLGVGNYRVNFLENLADNNYITMGSCTMGGAADFLSLPVNGLQDTTGVELLIGIQGATPTDQPNISVTALKTGD